MFCKANKTTSLCKGLQAGFNQTWLTICQTASNFNENFSHFKWKTVFRRFLICLPEEILLVFPYSLHHPPPRHPPPLFNFQQHPVQARRQAARQGVFFSGEKTILRHLHIRASAIVFDNPAITCVNAAIALSPDTLIFDGSSPAYVRSAFHFDTSSFGCDNAAKTFAPASLSCDKSSQVFARSAPGCVTDTLSFDKAAYGFVKYSLKNSCFFFVDNQINSI